MDARLRRIAAKLALVRGLPGRAYSFGEEKHGFRLGPPLPESRVAAFETEHGIRLPECYRSFLTTIGHIGTGPHYGLESLDDWYHAVLDIPRPGHLATPFPLSPTGPAPGPDWYEALDGDDPEPFPGALTLAQRGCSLATLLVVSGPARGRIVNVDLDLGPPAFCHDRDFLAWYERWLDETANGLDRSGFDVSLPYDVPTLTSLLREAPEPSQRDAAAWTLGRYPTLPPAAASALRAAAVGDADAGVRRAAVIALGRRPGPADEATLAQALTDPCDGPRLAARGALSRRGDGWHDQAQAQAQAARPAAGE
ncbi:HEAT repeat domain-containing protein [Streptomyces sp. NPDC101150]|uniref:HEAT repeat domain-containing protein n=1 Tax=Streptomyces sp. NPDC101150 TaxID=3366114 RepID=UPI003811CDE6